LALAAGGGADHPSSSIAAATNPTVRRHAIAGLVAHGDAAAVSTFFKGIHRDPDPRVRARAVAWLVARGAVSIDAA
jgi:HEAT repeat protein